MGKKKDKKRKALENNIPTPTSTPGSGNTKFQVPGIKYECSDEPVWLRVVLFVVSLGAIILAAYLVKGWVVALLAKDAVVSNMTKVVKFFKGKDP